MPQKSPAVSFRETEWRHTFALDPQGMATVPRLSKGAATTRPIHLRKT